MTVVLVHAAWADGSSWNKVTRELQRKGLNVVAAQIPLTSFSDDVEVLRKVLRRPEGPVVLAGAIASGQNATAIGTLSLANGINATALGGPGTTANGTNATALGQGSLANGDATTAIGQGSTATGIGATAIGQASTASGTRAFAGGIAASGSITGTSAIVRNSSHGSDAEADFPQVPGGAHDQASLERKTGLVSYRGKGPHGVSRNATFHGRENEVQIRFFARGSYPIGFQARRGRRTDQCSGEQLP